MGLKTPFAGRKGAVAPVAVILVILMVISAALGVYLVTSNLTAQGKEQAERDLEAQKRKISSSLAIEEVSGNSVYVRNTGKTPISSIFAYVDGRPIDFSTDFSAINPGEVKEILLDAAPTFGVHTVKIVGNSIAQDTVKISGKNPDIFKWRLPLTVQNRFNKDYRLVWALSGSGMEIPLAHQAATSSLVVLDQNGLEMPSTVSTNWYDLSWKMRKAVVLFDKSGYGMDGELGVIQVSGLSLQTGSCSETALADASGIIVPFEILADSKTSCTYLTPISITPGGQATYYVYYSRPTAFLRPESSAKVAHENTTETDCFSSGRIDICINKGFGGISNLSVTGRENLLAWGVGQNGKYYGITPSVEYQEGWDNSACSVYRTISTQVLKETDLYTEIEHVLGTTCSGKDYRYEYLITMYPGAPYFDLELSNLDTLNFKGRLHNVLLLSSWGRVWPSDGVFVESGKYASQKDEKYGVGVSILRASGRALSGFIRPANFNILDDSSALAPSTIWKERTFVVLGDARELASSGYYRSQPDSFSVVSGQDEGAPSKVIAKVDFALSIQKEQQEKVYLYYTDSVREELNSRLGARLAITGVKMDVTLGTEESVVRKPAGNSSSSK